MTADPSASALPSVFQRLGPEAFWRIARAFYARVPSVGAISHMFPASLDEPIRNQAEFLIQYFGGPTTYSQRKGHPRLRMRHAQFRIGLAERNAWVENMRQALADAEIPQRERAEMMAYFNSTATFMMNDDAPSG